MVENPEFSGEFEHTLDEKGRIIIPSILRKPLGEKFYLSPSLISKCIWALPASTWQYIGNSFLAQINPLDKVGQKFVTKFSSYSFPAEMDKQGRIIVPQKLREYAEIEENKIILLGITGSPSRIEIWSYDKYKKIEKEDDIIELAEVMFKERNLTFNPQAFSNPAQ